MSTFDEKPYILKNVLFLLTACTRESCLWNRYKSKSAHISLWNGGNVSFNRILPVLSFFPHLPSPFLMCCAILPTSFKWKGPHLRRWLVAQPSSTVSLLRFSGVFLGCKVNARRPEHSTVSIPGNSRILNVDYIWNGVRPASWRQLGRTCLK